MATKLCTGCDTEKPVEDFNRNGAKRDGLQAHCRSCDNAAGLRHYQANRGEYIARAASQRKALRAYVSELKGGPCEDCGGVFPPEAMDFDHRDPSAKRHDVGKMIGLGSKPAVLAEIAKCDLVCANCHRVRTKARRRNVSA